MKSFKAKLTILLIAMLVVTMLVPFGSVAAANEGVQIIKEADGDVVIYVDGLETSFEYALSEEAGATEMDLNYINSVEDDEGNQVALISASDFAESENNLYIRTEDETVTYTLDFSDMLTQDKMEEVKNTSNRISTSVLTGIVDRTETIEGKNYTYTVGGLKIEDDANAEYSYQIFKSTDERYSELQSLADELNSDGYDNEPMYTKIELANNFYNLYNELLAEVDWQPVDESMEIKQPSDATDGEKYIVMLRKVAEDGTTYDAKFMKSNLGIDEGQDEKVEQQEVTTQETSKLPITGDSIVLFVVLAALVIIAIVVFIRMKKLNKKADK